MDTKTKEVSINHWENIYKTKTANEVSWTQNFPSVSALLFDECNLNKEDHLIDVGCGESAIVPYWIKKGYSSITALDIAESALEKLKLSLAENASKVCFVGNSILDFEPEKPISFWHDRAVFHFLTNEQDIEKYIEIVNNAVVNYLCIATFSKDGPEKCSGLPVSRYDKEGLSALFAEKFNLIKVVESEHDTPFNTKQNFLFCLFKRK